MTCGLSEDEIDVLYWFYSKHLLSPRASLHEDAVYARLSVKIDNPEQLVKGLRTKLFIGKHKTICLYADMGRTLTVLRSHRASLLPAYLRPRPDGP